MCAVAAPWTHTEIENKNPRQLLGALLLHNTFPHSGVFAVPEDIQLEPSHSRGAVAVSRQI